MIAPPFATLAPWALSALYRRSYFVADAADVVAATAATAAAYWYAKSCCYDANVTGKIPCFIVRIEYL